MTLDPVQPILLDDTHVIGNCGAWVDSFQSEPRWVRQPPWAQHADSSG